VRSRSFHRAPAQLNLPSPFLWKASGAGSTSRAGLDLAQMRARQAHYTRAYTHARIQPSQTQFRSLQRTKKSTVLFDDAVLEGPTQTSAGARLTSDPSDAALAESSALAADPTRCPAQTLLSCARQSCVIKRGGAVRQQAAAGGGGGGGRRCRANSMAQRVALVTPAGRVPSANPPTRQRPNRTRANINSGLPTAFLPPPCRVLFFYLRALRLRMAQRLLGGTTTLYTAHAALTGSSGIQAPWREHLGAWLPVKNAVSTSTPRIRPGSPSLEAESSKKEQGVRVRGCGGMGSKAAAATKQQRV